MSAWARSVIQSIQAPNCTNKMMVLCMVCMQNHVRAYLQFCAQDTHVTDATPYNSLQQIPHRGIHSQPMSTKNFLPKLHHLHARYSHETECPPLSPIIPEKDGTSAQNTQRSYKVHTGDQSAQSEFQDRWDMFMEEFFPSANPTLASFLKTQSRCCRDAAAGKDARSRRYDKDTKSLCLSAWIASPNAYRLWSKYFYVPSPHSLQMIKNSIAKEPGISMDMIRWMHQECERTQAPKQGGIIFDEMSIQSGIQLEPQGEGLRMTGYVDYGPGQNGIQEANKSIGIHLASSVLQFIFLSYNGFRFPFSYMLTSGFITGQLTSLFWDIINTLSSCDFTIDFVCKDGAAVNRAFINSIVNQPMSVARNITSLIPNKICCIMDFSHVVKKIRNSLEASAAHRNRHLLTRFGPLLWEHFTQAFLWDKAANFLRIHRKLTDDHFHLNSTLKMRNDLAQEVLNSDMLYLLQTYRDYLVDGSHMLPAIKLVQITSDFISVFRSPDPIQTLHDERLAILVSVKTFFEDWKSYCVEQEAKEKLEKQPYITEQCHQDLLSCIDGFISLCHQKIASTSITPRIINSDVCENIFCQQRTTYNGPNTNPDAAHYRYKSHSTIILNATQGMHAVYSPTGKVLWVFVPGKLVAGFKNPLKLWVVNLNCDDIFIMFKATTQQGADCSFSWAFV